MTREELEQIKKKWGIMGRQNEPTPPKPRLSEELITPSLIEAFTAESSLTVIDRLCHALEAAWEEREVAQQIGDTFWDALKPLNLPAINVHNPGSHVTALIIERDALKAHLRSIYKELDALKHAYADKQAEVDRFKRLLYWAQ